MLLFNVINSKFIRLYFVILQPNCVITHILYFTLGN